MNALISGIDSLRNLSGWRRWLAAFIAGLSCALAQAPFYLLPLLAVGVSALVLLLDGVNGPKWRRATFALGWFFGLGYYLLGLYWMAFSFFVQAEQFAWMAPFAMLGMPSFLGLFTGAALVLAKTFWRDGPQRIFIFVTAYMAFEYARGHILTGLPWNLPGQALAGAAVSAQTAAWYGVYGLSLVTLLIAAMPVAFIPVGSTTALRNITTGIAASLAASILLVVAGAARLASADNGIQGDVHIRIVQPNIPQREKINPQYWWRNLDRAISLSTGPAPDNGQLFIVWPENAAPVIDEVPSGLKKISDSLPGNAVLISGAVRRDRTNETERFYNAVAIIGETPSGHAPIAYYDKHHLVPFGEYLPFKTILNAIGLAQLAPYEDGFTSGAGPQTIKVADTSFSPLICYEAIFPGALHPEKKRPDWLVTVTNDAWFGDTSGPRQHLDQARLRSIESGLPMARSANTGISALIDASGRYIARLPLYEPGVIDSAMPMARAPTLYSRFSDGLFYALMIMTAALGLFRTGRKN